VQGILWSRLPPDRARHSLNQALYLLRKELGEDCVVSEGDRLRVTPHLRMDAQAFQRAAEDGEAEAALEHYGGEFLQGWHLRDTPEFEQWTDRVRGRLARLHRQARRNRLSELVQAGDLSGAQMVASDWVRLDPWEDEAHHAVIDLLARTGRRTEALEQYEAYHAMLLREDLPPLEETEALVGRIRAGDLRPGPGVAPATLPDPPSPSPELPPSAARPRRLDRRLGALGAVAVLIVLGTLFRVDPGGPTPAGPAASPDRILVYPLENRTGDPTLDAVGALAADWIAQGLGWVESVQVVPAGELLSGGEPSASGASGVRARETAARTGSGMLVTGAYYRTEDDVAFQVQILSAPRWEMFGSVGPVYWAGDDPLEAVDILRQRVVVQVAVDRDRSLHGIFSESEMPPTYPAYLAYVEGFRRFVRGDFRGAAGRLLEANEISPEFTSPLVIAGFALIQGWGDYRAADSVARIVDASRERLPRYDRLRLDLLRATLQGDNARAYEAVREAAAVLPGGTAHYAWGQKALELNRPGEALEILSTWDIDREGARAWMPYWDVVTQAHHLLGEHDEELAAAARARDANPDRIESAWFQIRALAAQGSVEELLRVAGESASHRPTPALDAGSILLHAVEELIVHGFEDRVGPVLTRFHTWHRELPADERSRPRLQAQRGRAYYLEGRFEEAHTLFSTLADAEPGSPEPLRFLGTIAALTGDVHGATAKARALAQLDGEYLFGRPALARAAIAARLGDGPGALSLLQAAVSQGVVFGTGLHADPDLSVLAGDASFQAFMRPGG
jgi:tetratricopeptide (TPR) repeat protein